MKKLIFTILIFFIGITSIYAKTATFTRTFIGKYHYMDENGSWGDFELFEKNGDHLVAYCIEPGTPFYGNVSFEEYDINSNNITNKFHISKSIFKQISLWVHYGYGYENHTDISWYVATQFKIWELLGRKASFTSENEPSNPWKHVISIPSEIQNRIHAIEKLITEHNMKPYITDLELELPLGKEYTAQDELLKRYTLKTQDKNVVLRNDTLSIKALENVSSTKVLLERKNNYWNDSQLAYFNNTEQNLLTIGNAQEETIQFSYETYSGKIKILKLDQDTKECMNSFDEAIYGIYKKDNTLIEKRNLKNCEATFESLPLGNYYIQEISAPEEYELDTNKYEFQIMEENILKDQTITVYQKKKLIPVHIQKYYLAEDNTHIPEENAIFEIIDVKTNQKMGTLETDALGETSILLPLGEYKIVLIKGKENYKLVDDKYFKIDESTTNLDFSFLNEPYIKKVKVIKFEENSKKKVKLANIKFKIYDTIQKKYICENEECTYSTDENGELIANLRLSTYELEEVEQNFESLSWNKDKVTFSLTMDSPLITEIKFYNKKKTGSFEILKLDEKNNPLEKVEFEIYASSNIYDVDHTIIYSQNEKVATITTNKSGVSRLDLLPFGSYYIKETKTKENYILDEKIHEINISDLNTSLTLQNYPITKRVKVIKLEKNTKTKVKLANIKFKIYDTIQKKYICENEECTYSTDENGEFITGNLNLSTYFLEEVEQDFEDYLWNPEKVTFTLTMDSPEITEIYFYNERKEEPLRILFNKKLENGELKILKTDEQENPLENVEFEIFAKEDIKDVDNRVLYEKLKRITTIKTNSKGIATLTLPLGSYYITEVKTKEAYILDNNVYEISLTRNNATATLKLINYKIPITKKDKNYLPILFILGGMYFYDKKTKYRMFHNIITINTK